MFLSKTFGGNTHMAVGYVNSLRCAAYLFQIIRVDSDCSILVFKIPSREDRVSARAELGLVEEPQ